MATLRRIGVLKIGVVMEVYLSHWSALRCWRLLRRMGSLSSSYIELGACAPHGRPSLRATSAELQRVRDAYGLGDNLHVLVAGMIHTDFKNPPQECIPNLRRLGLNLLVLFLQR